MPAHMWNSLKKNISALKKLRRERRRAKSYQPRVELLEVRLALSTLVVNTLADLADPVAGKLSLRQALAASQDGDTILLAAKGTYKLTQNDGGEGTDLDVFTSVTIASKSGAGSAIIDGNKTDRVFDICGDENVVIQGVTIQNGLIDDDGAGIYVDDDGGGSLTLNNAIVRYNTASDAGGGVYVDGDTYLAINNSTFNNNLSGDDGGGVCFYGTSMDVKGSTFKFNKSGSDGGAIYFDGYTDEDGDVPGEGMWMDLNIAGSTFSSNKASEDGGAVYFESWADEDDDYHDADVDVQGCVFADNLAGDGGGGLYVYDDDGDVTTWLSVTGSTFRNNASAYGGGVCSDDVEYTWIERSTFTTNRGSYDGGGLAVEDGWDCDVVASTFTGNLGANGAGVYAYYTDLNVEHSTFTNNKATYWGGGLLADYDDEGDYDVSVTDSTFKDNSANSGAGVAFEEAGSATVTGCTFSGNKAIFSGGGIFYYAYFEEEAYEEDTSLTVTNCVLDRNTAGAQDTDEGGGGIFFYSEDAESSEVTITGTTVTNNYSGKDGGGIYVEDYESDYFDATLTGLTVTGNTAGDYGGGILVWADAYDDNDVDIANCTVASNRSTDDGGGLYVWADLGENAAPRANAATTDDADPVSHAAADGGRVTVTACTFSSNTTSDDGGGAAIETDGYDTVYVINNTFTGNVAGDDGGGLNMDVGEGELINNTIALNKSQSSGGGFHNENDVHVLNNLIAKNTCASGNGIDVCNDGELYDEGYNLIGIDDETLFTLATDIAGSVGAPVDPKLGSLANNGGPTKTMALKKGSPAIDAGADNTVDGDVPGVDQRGKLRGTLVDIGAFEVV